MTFSYPILFGIIMMLPFVGLALLAEVPAFLSIYKKLLVWVPVCVAFIAAGYLTFQSLAPLPLEAYPVIFTLTVAPATTAAISIYGFRLNIPPTAPFALSSSFLVGVFLLPGGNLGLALLLALSTVWLLKVAIDGLTPPSP